MPDRGADALRQRRARDRRRKGEIVLRISVLEPP